MLCQFVSRFRAATVALIAIGTTISAVSAAHADTVPQSLPFAQNWSNVSLITLDDDWSGVPGIIGIRGDDLTSATGTDPQTIVAEQATVDVIANQSSPGISNGGVAEFDGIPDHAVALQGSGTADAPYIQITIGTAGALLVRVQYNLRDLDASADNAVQPVALQYRVGTTGNFTNVPAAFVADATTGPSLATLVTPINVVLPAETGNQPVVQLRVIISNAVGNDEWVAVDDISITAASTALTATGSADPNVVVAGGSTILQVVALPATGPASTGIAVEADLSSIGGAPDQPFYDDATHGDDAADDNIFHYEATVALLTTPGGKLLPIVVTDAETRSAQFVLPITVTEAVAAQAGDAPVAFAALPPFPNPFLSATSVTFEIPRSTAVSITVFDAKGRVVKVLQAGMVMPAGRHTVAWAGRGEGGRRVAAGVYLFRVATTGDSAVRTVVALE